MLCLLALTIQLAWARPPTKKVDLRPPQKAQTALDIAKPQEPQTSRKDESRLGLSVKSSIPEKIITRQVEAVDPKPYTSDSALPNIGETLKNSTNGVDLKVRF